MAATTQLAVRFRRLYAEALDNDYAFTTAERTTYLGNGLRYPGQVVIDITEDKMYRLNFARNAWLPLGSSALPDQAGQAGKYLKTDGTSVSWSTVDSLPSQSGNSGKYLKTDGTTATWQTAASNFSSLSGSPYDNTLLSAELVKAIAPSEFTLRTDPDIKTTSDQVAIRGYVNTITALYAAADGSVPTSTNFTYNYRVATTSTWTTGVTLAALNSALANSSDANKIVWVTATNTTNTVPAAVILTVKKYA